MLEVGAPAPGFTLDDHDGEPLSLDELRGRPVVLYFYPKAETPGCTTQACGVRDHSVDYARAGARVLGVSPDNAETIRRFHHDLNLNFTLLADEAHSVADSFGVWVEKSIYGKTHWGVQRATFVIDAQGKIVHVIEKVSPATHDDEVLRVLRGLGQR